MTRLAVVVLLLACFSSSLLAVPFPEARHAITNPNRPIQDHAGEDFYEVITPPPHHKENILQKALHRFGFASKSDADNGSSPLLGTPANHNGHRKANIVSGGQPSANAESAKQTKADFSYNENAFNGPSKWQAFAPECGGKRQSPISISSKDLTIASVWKRLKWNDYDRRPSSMELVNNGHSVQVSGTWFGARRPSISYGPLVGDYVFEQLHFHWGADNKHGSEHIVNSVQFPMELHLVHYKKDYGSLAEALKHGDGVAVVAYMFDVKENTRPNQGLATIISRFNEVIKPGPAVSVGTFPLVSMVQPFVNNYASYVGSLTTPPCTQAVTWLIASQPIYIPQDQMDSFRKLQGSEGPMSGNYRPTQPINDRTIYYIPA